MANQLRGVYERDKGSGIWWIRYADVHGKKRREKVGRRSDAIQLLAKRKTEVCQGRKLPENFRQRFVTFSELASDALEHSMAENGARTHQELKLKLDIIIADFGSSAADSITRQDVQRWLTTQAKKREWKAATINRWQAAFSLVFRVAQDNEKIERNPAARIRRKVENNVIRFLAPDEVAKLRSIIFRRCPHHIHAFDLSLNTGMRASEQFSLTWSQIDLDRKTLTLPKTKNGKMRHIPLNSVAVAAFLALKRQSNGSPNVFLNRYGEPLRGSRDWFEPVMQEANLGGYTWHVNRHTFASRLAMAGISLQSIGELLGHSSHAMTLRYAHLCPTFNAASVERLCQTEQRDTKTDTGTFDTLEGSPIAVQ